MPVTANTTKYYGAKPGMARTDEDTARLRATVPDDPIPLPTGFLACEGCGLPHAGPAVVSLPMDSGGRLVAQYTRCSECQHLHDKATDRGMLHVLYALAVIGQKPPEDPAPLEPWLRLMGGAVAFADPESPSRTLCAPHAWAHVSLGQRAKIREALVLAMRSRISAGAPALRIPPPWGGACLFCGVGSLPMAPIDVVRRGGRENAAHAIWRRILTYPSSLGGHGPEPIDGFLCPPCSEAADSVGAIGVRARGRAFEKHVRRTSPSEADRVKALLDDADNIVLPGWGGLGTWSPNAQPWAHIVIPEPPS